MRATRLLPFQIHMTLRVALLVLVLTASFLWVVLNKVQRQTEMEGRESFRLLSASAFGEADGTMDRYLKLLDHLRDTLPLLPDPASKTTQTILARTLLPYEDAMALYVTRASGEISYVLRVDPEAPQGTVYTAGHIANDAQGHRWGDIAYFGPNNVELHQRRIDATAVPRSQWYPQVRHHEKFASPVFRFPGGPLGFSLFSKLPDDVAGEAIVGVSMSVALLDRMLDRLPLSAHGTALLLDDQQRVVAMRLGGSIWNTLNTVNVRMKPVTEIDQPALATAVAAAVRAKAGNAVQRVTLQGADYLMAGHQVLALPGMGYRIVLLAPMDDLTVATAGAQRTTWLLTLFGLGIVLPLTWLTAGVTARRLQDLLRTSERITRMDFTPAPLLKTKVRELQQLAQAQDTMRAGLQARTHALEQASSQLAALIDAQRQLLDSLVRILCDAIDAKSPYTGRHCVRVPELALMLAQEAHATDTGPLATFRFETEAQWREFRIGAWLHDCGKITSPEHVIDKATRLEMVYNRLHEVRMRFEVLLRDARIHALESVRQGRATQQQADTEYARRAAVLTQDFSFLAACNQGPESMSAEDAARVRSIGSQRWQRHFDDRIGLSWQELALRGDGPAPALPATETLLADQPWHRVPREPGEAQALTEGFKMRVPEHAYDHGELHNLCLPRGTLTEEERFKVNEHIIHTIRMLENANFPAPFTRVPEYAGTHHETLDGGGYPRGLTAAELSVPARIMTIADIFEALTAKDRPYKQGKPLSEVVGILHRLVRRGKIDGDLFALFLRTGVHLRYAQRFLSPEQIDSVDVEAVLGTPPLDKPNATN